MKIFAEKRAARNLRERSLFHFAPDAAKRLAYLAKDVFLVGLHFRDFRAQHVRLFAVFEMLAATLNLNPCTPPRMLEKLDPVISDVR